jgi:hypothetical protein
VKEILMLASMFVLFGGSAVICVFTLTEAITANDRFRDIILLGNIQGVQRSLMIDRLTHMFNPGFLMKPTLENRTTAPSGVRSGYEFTRSAIPSSTRPAICCGRRI